MKNDTTKQALANALKQLLQKKANHENHHQ